MVSSGRDRHAGTGTFLLRLKSQSRERVTWLNFDCGTGISRSIPVVTTGSSATSLLIKSRARKLSICLRAESDATLSITRMPKVMAWLLRRLCRLRPRTGVSIGSDVFVQQVRGAAPAVGSPIEQIILNTPRLATLEAFGASLLKDGVVDRALIGNWPSPPDSRHLATEQSMAAIGVVVHLHYRDVWPEVEWFLRKIPFPFRLAVSLTEPEQAGDGTLRARIGKMFDHAHIRTLPNRGRDIAPFLTMLKDDALADCSILCKIHGKKSDGGSGDDLIGRIWRRRCMLDLLGTADRVSEAVSLLAAGSDLGMVGPQALLQARSDRIKQSKEEKNQAVMRALLAERGLNQIATDEYSFFAGTMFWVRRDALRMVENMNLADRDFPAEPAPGNGTISHAMERLFGVSVIHAGLRLAGLSEIDAGFAKIDSPAPGTKKDRYQMS